MTKRLGVALGWHCLEFTDLLDCVRRAEAHGFEVAYIDGDVSQIPSRRDADVLDGMTLTTALLAKTERIHLSSIRLVHHWNAAKLAQAVATQERIAPGRQRLLLSIGGQPSDRRFGLPLPPARDRVVWLDELCEALRALFRGEAVTRTGRFVALDGARTPALRAAPTLEIGAAGPAMLGVVARHADAWNINVPALREHLARADGALTRACETAGRDPTSIERVLWIFARPLEPSPNAALREGYRRWNPWFANLSDSEIDEALLVGSASERAERLEALHHDSAIDLPIVDLSGLDADATRQSIDALAEGSGASENPR